MAFVFFRDVDHDLFMIFIIRVLFFFINYPINPFALLIRALYADLPRVPRVGPRRFVSFVILNRHSILKNEPTRT